MTTLASIANAEAGSTVRAKINYLIDPDTGREASYFGLVPEAFNLPLSSYTNQLTNMQAAFDWSAANRKPVFFGGGVYGFSGTITVKSDTKIFGAGYHSTFFQQLNTTWPDCLVAQNYATTGVAAVVLHGFCIDGAWDKKASYGVGGNWNYDSTTLTQRGLALAAPSGGASGNNADSLNDTHNRISNLRFTNIAGTGLVTAGRGEMRLNDLWFNTMANMGADFGAFDCWIDTVTLAVCGKQGWKQSGGNSRLSNFKCWFIGYCTGTGEDSVGSHGIGFEVAGSSTRNIVGTNITTQDTWGSGFKSAGEGNFIQGGVDSCGSLYQTGGNGGFGIGLSTAHSSYVIEFATTTGTAAKFEKYVLAVADRNVLTVKQRLANIQASGTRGNRVTLAIDEAASAVPYDTTTPIVVAAGNVSAKRLNFVESDAGKIFLGAVTAAQLADAAHDVNASFYKTQGTARYDSTNNRMLYAAGGNTTDQWYANGTSVITPA